MQERRGIRIMESLRKPLPQVKEVIIIIINVDLIFNFKTDILFFIFY